jgi:hypothetical protein
MFLFGKKEVKEIKKIEEKEIKLKNKEKYLFQCILPEGEYKITINNIGVQKFLYRFTTSNCTKEGEKEGDSKKEKIVIYF